MTASGVGRVAALQSVFVNGIAVKVDVLKVHYDLQKRLVAVNNLYIYGHRFKNLRQYNITQNEIVFTKRNPKHTKKYNRRRFVNTQKKTWINRIIPYMG